MEPRPIGPYTLAVRDEEAHIGGVTSYTRGRFSVHVSDIPDLINVLELALEDYHQPRGEVPPVTLSWREALERLNQLRSNMIATQSATWSNISYPLVAILEAAGFELIEDVTEEQKQEHLDTYGGAGGYPGARKEVPTP